MPGSLLLLSQYRMQALLSRMRRRSPCGLFLDHALPPTAPTHRYDRPWRRVPQFYDNCYRSLRTNGVLAVNTCGNKKLTPMIQYRFRNQMVVKDTERNFNCVVIAGKGTALEKEAHIEPGALGLHRRPPRRKWLPVVLLQELQTFVSAVPMHPASGEPALCS